MSYTALLFDLDDTVLDFSASEEAALTQLCQTFFFPYHAEQAVKKTFRTINTQLWHLVALEKMTPAEVKEERFRSLLQELKVDIAPETVARFYEQALGEKVIWFEGVEKTLELLKEHYEIGFITNGLTAVQRKKYALSGISIWCTCFIISEEVGIAKPNPKIFDLALGQLSARPQDTLMVGDSLASDYRGAIDSGLDFCWINPAKTPLPAGYPPPAFTLGSVVGLPNELKDKTN